MIAWPFFFSEGGPFSSSFICCREKKLEQFFSNLETCSGLLVTNKTSLGALISFGSRLWIPSKILKFTSSSWSLIYNLLPSTSVITLAVFMNSIRRMRGTSTFSSMSSMTKFTSKVNLSTCTSTSWTTPFGHLID